MQSRLDLELPLQFALRLHHASRLHFDLRIWIYDSLLSFCLPEAPYIDPTREVEAIFMPDHNPKYLKSEWVIPKGRPGAGPTMPVDIGTVEVSGKIGSTPEREILRQLAEGNLRLTFLGSHLKGIWNIVRQRKGDWTFQNLADDEASQRFRLLLDRSSLTGRTHEELIRDLRNRGDYP